MRGNMVSYPDYVNNISSNGIATAIICLSFHKVREYDDTFPYPLKMNPSFYDGLRQVVPRIYSSIKKGVDHPIDLDRYYLYNLINLFLNEDEVFALYNWASLVEPSPNCGDPGLGWFYFFQNFFNGDYFIKYFQALTLRQREKITFYHQENKAKTLDLSDTDNLTESDRELDKDDQQYLYMIGKEEATKELFWDCYFDIIWTQYDRVLYKKILDELTEEDERNFYMEATRLTNQINNYPLRNLFVKPIK